MERPIIKDQLTTAFQETFGEEPAVIIRAPGRVNLLGEHVDYSEGWVLPAAIDRAVWLAVSSTNADHVTLRALDLEEQATFHLSEINPKSAIGNPKSWLNYPAGVAWVLQKAGHSLGGLKGVYTSTVPIGAGVSSSAAVEVAFILAWETLSGLALSGMERARLGQRVENEYLGLKSGIMDQFASVHGAADHLILLDCRTLHHELIPFPAGTAIVVADSGVRRELATSEYNLRRSQCEEAVELLRPYLPHIRTLRDVSTEEFERYAHRLPDLLRRRARHVVEECARVLEGSDLLRRGDMAGFGTLVRQSHISLRDLYEVSILELNVLAAAAWQLPGCYGARLTGAGFGGCVIALVREEAAAAAQAAMSDAFQQEFGRQPDIFVCEVSEGAKVLTN
jgi:galactokinase